MYKLIIFILFALLSCAENNTSKPPTDSDNNTDNPSNNAGSNNNVVVDGPSIRVPEEVLFPRVTPISEETRDATWETIEVINRGSEPLVIYRVEIAGTDSPFSVSYPASPGSDPSRDSNVAPGTVAPGKSFFIRIYFNPTSNAYAESNLVIITNDPNQPESVVEMRGNFGSCVEFEVDELNFGRVAPGTSGILSVSVSNCNDSLPLEVSSVEVAGDGFELSDSPSAIAANGGVILPNESVNMLLSFLPTTRRDYAGELVVTLSDSARPITLPLKGVGDFPCPTAHAKVRLQFADGGPAGPLGPSVEAFPSTYVGFDASESTSPNGEIAEYEWTVVQKPTNSVATLQPSNTAANPTLYLDTLGTFIIELKVVDDAGVASCEDEATHRVSVSTGTPAEVLIELTWDTPTDPDQTDTFGADLDLHYMHPSGRWNQAPFDIFWRNRTADWGSSGDADDPNLDIDDTDGSGPEIISHDALQPLIYQVGVYYYADKGFGPSYATIRVFIEGIQRYEWRNEYLSGTGVFWRAATIEWPTQQIEPVNQKQTGFPGN